VPLLHLGDVERGAGWFAVLSAADVGFCHGSAFGGGSG
jgi:hypothetical protein